MPVNLAFVLDVQASRVGTGVADVLRFRSLNLFYNYGELPNKIGV